MISTKSCCFGLLSLICLLAGSAGAAPRKGLRFFDDDKLLPRAYRLGLIYSKENIQTLTLDGTDRRYGLANFRAGIEWKPVSALSARVGYKMDETGSLFSGVGLGFKTKFFGEQLSYIYLPLSGSGKAHLLSITCRFGAKKPSYR